MITIDSQQDVVTKTAQTFSDYLLVNEPALKYLENRGISRELAANGMVGYCPPFYNYWWPLLKGRITVPLQDVHGKIIAFAGRQYDQISKNATIDVIRQIYSKNPVEAEKKISMWERAKWINEPYPKIRHLYNLNNAKEHIRTRNYAIVVEGYFDVLVLASNNLPNTVAVCGGKLSERHAVLLSRFCDNVIILSDGDAAGESFTEPWAKTLTEFGLKHHTILLPNGYDPDDFVLKIGGKRFKKIIENMISDDKLKLKLSLQEAN